MAALIPGLAVKVEGTYNNDNQLVAKSVSFKAAIWNGPNRSRLACTKTRS